MQTQLVGKCPLSEQLARGAGILAGPSKERQAGRHPMQALQRPQLTPARMPVPPVTIHTNI